MTVDSELGSFGRGFVQGEGRRRLLSAGNPAGSLDEQRYDPLDANGAHVRVRRVGPEGLTDAAADGNGLSRLHHDDGPGAGGLRVRALEPKKLVMIEGGHFDPFLSNSRGRAALRGLVHEASWSAVTLH